MAAVSDISRGRVQQLREESVVAIPENISNFAKDKGMCIFHIGRRRTFGPLLDANHGCVPEKGSEVYIGKLPRDCFEPELVPFLEKVAPLYQLRLLIKYDGSTYGYGFATYYNSFYAEKAVAALNDTEIRERYHVQVSRCIERLVLILSGVPTDQSHQEIETAITQTAFGVVNVQLLWNEGNPEHPTGLVLVSFINYRAAYLARNKINSGDPFGPWGWEIVADWEQTDIGANKDYANSKYCHSLFLSRFTPGTLWKELCAYLKSLHISGVKFIEMTKRGIFAFIYFYKKTDAENARFILNGSSFQGHKLRAEWKKPKRMKWYDWYPQQDVYKEGDQDQVQDGEQDPEEQADEQADEQSELHDIENAGGQYPEEQAELPGYHAWADQYQNLQPFQVFHFVPMYMVAPNSNGLPGIGFIPYYIDWTLGIPLFPVMIEQVPLVPYVD